MKIFSSYIKKSKNGKIEDVIILDDFSLSLKAFFFGFFWFLYKKMWKEFIVLILINYLILSLYNHGLLGNYFNFFVLEIGLMFLVASNAEYWYGEHLKKMNYKFAGLYFGKDKIDAKLRFIDVYKKSNNTALVFNV